LRSDTGEVWLRFLILRAVWAQELGLLVAAQTGDAPLDGARVAIFGAAIVWLIGNCFEIAASGRLTQVICAGVVVVAV
jgi:hypothetical protein